MLMVLCETPSRTTRVSPFYVVHGCDMDPGLLDTINFPKDKSSGSSQKETEAIPQNIVESKLVTIERMNKKPNRIHLQLQVGDQVLLRLGQRKTVEDDRFTVASTPGSDIEARNNCIGESFNNISRNSQKFQRRTSKLNRKLNNRSGQDMKMMSKNILMVHPVLSGMGLVPRNLSCLSISLMRTKEQLKEDMCNLTTEHKKQKLIQIMQSHHQL